MATVLTAHLIYAIFVSVVLICSTLSLGRSDPVYSAGSFGTRLAYEPVSAALLNIWRTHCSNLLIIELCDDHHRDVNEAVLGSLRVRAVDLLALLRWLPPKATLVFCANGDIGRFDTQIEEVICDAEIQTVYMLEGAIESWLSLARCEMPTGDWAGNGKAAV